MDRHIVFLTPKYRPKPIPEVGKRYHCFDDGKITFSRHFIIKVDEVLGFMQFKKKYPEMVEQYIQETKTVIGCMHVKRISLLLLLKERMMNLGFTYVQRTEAGLELVVGQTLLDWMLLVNYGKVLFKILIFLTTPKKKRNN